jgi:hypothetical protein
MNVSRGKSAVLQAFLNASEQLQRYGSAFTRQRSLVRAQHRPQEKRCFAGKILTCVVGSQYSLEAVGEGSNTGEPPQHQAAHHRIDHGLARLTQPLSMSLLILLL